MTKTEMPEGQRAPAGHPQRERPAHDVLVINAGSSAGTEDFTETLITGVRRACLPRRGNDARQAGHVRPDRRQTRLRHTGIPGLGRSKLQGLSQGRLRASFAGSHTSEWTVQCITPYNLPSAIGVEEMLRVRLVAKDRRYYAYPLPRGAGSFPPFPARTRLVTDTGERGGLQRGRIPSGRCSCGRRTSSDTGSTSSGSHDLSLDVLRDMIKTRSPPSISYPPTWAA